MGRARQRQPQNRAAPDCQGLREERLRAVYDTLLDAFGAQGWWPGDGPFEVMVGAVLTQNTSWRNAERAIRRLSAAGALEPESLTALGVAEIEDLVRPSGSFRRKAGTLWTLSRDVVAFPGGLPAYLARDTDTLRSELLSIRGIGPETADSILLYAAGRGRFVVDAYARRFAERHGLSDGRQSYDGVAELFERALGADPVRLGECHALLVELGKRFCRPHPACDACPLSYDLRAV